MPISFPTAPFPAGANDVWFGVYYDTGTSTSGLGIGIDNTYVYATGFDESTLFDGNQHTASATWDSVSGDYEIFVDGVSVGAGTGLKTGYTISGGGELVIGMDQDSVGGGFQSDQVFQGTLFDARIFNDVRSATEISDGHGQTLPHSEAGMLANWTFGDLSLGGVTTEAVSGNNLTVKHASGGGFSASTPALTLSVHENAANGTEVGTATGTDNERELAIASLLAADPNLSYSEVTGKFYKSVSGPDTWANALTAATSSTLSGVSGQLVTIDSAADNEIVHGIAQSLGSNVWIGASDEGAEGEWRWYDGSSPGDQFWQGDSSGVATNGEFSNWRTGQPGAGTTDDDYAVLRQTDGEWADRISTSTNAYVVEWNADDVLDQTDEITYSLAPGGDAGGRFAIDADSGQITVANGLLLDYETTTSHDITVRITDNTGNSTDLVLTISVLDIFETAPTLDNSQNLTLDTIQKDELPSRNDGNSVLEILNSGTGNPITDPDGPQTGIAINSVDDSNGVWEYSTDGGTNWSPIDLDGAGSFDVNNSNALLMEADAGNQNRIRFNPNAGYTGSAGDIQFRAWDGTEQPSLGSGSYVDIDAVGVGGVTPFSSAQDTATLRVNDNPTIGPNCRRANHGQHHDRPDQLQYW